MKTTATFLLSVFILFSGLAAASACSDACKAGYDKDVNESLAIMQAKGYWQGMMSTNCWSRWNTPSGQPEPCWNGIAVCQGACSGPGYQACMKSCNDAFQTCCHESAVLNAQHLLDGCVKNCPNETTPAPACQSACASDQKQELYPSCACVTVPPCPEPRDLSQVTDRNNLGIVQEIEVNAAVLILRSDTNTFCAVKSGSTFIVLPGERVRTVGGHATVRSGYGYMIFMTPGSTFEMEDWAKTSASNQGSVSGMFMKMLDGIYVFIVRPNTVGKFEIQFDSANLGVRGTEFLVQKNADQSLFVYLVEGKLEASAVNNPGLVKNLSAGQKISIAPDGTPGDPQPFSLSEAENIWGGPLPAGNQSAECVQASDCPGAQFCRNGKCVEPTQCLSSVVILGTALAAFVLYVGRKQFGLG